MLLVSFGLVAGTREVGVAIERPALSEVTSAILVVGGCVIALLYAYAGFVALMFRVLRNDSCEDTRVTADKFIDVVTLGHRIPCADAGRDHLPENRGRA